MIGFLPFLFAALVVTGDVKTSMTLTKRDIIALGVAGIMALGLGGTFIFISLSKRHVLFPFHQFLPC